MPGGPNINFNMVVRPDSTLPTIKHLLSVQGETSLEISWPLSHLRLVSARASTFIESHPGQLPPLQAEDHTPEIMEVDNVPMTSSTAEEPPVHPQPDNLPPWQDDDQGLSEEPRTKPKARKGAVKRETLYFLDKISCVTHIFQVRHLGGRKNWFQVTLILFVMCFYLYTFCT